MGKKNIALAREVGYEGQELRDFLKKQQDFEREERVAQMNHDQEKREVKQIDKDREAAQRVKELDIEKIKLEAEQRDRDGNATQNIKDKESVMRKIEAEVELKEIEAEATSHLWGPKNKSQNPRNPKLPYFDKHTDKMDRYFTRFESNAISNKWELAM